jgi:hypothetical protein
MFPCRIAKPVLYAQFEIDGRETVHIIQYVQSARRNAATEMFAKKANTRAGSGIALLLKTLSLAFRRRA